MTARSPSAYITSTVLHLLIVAVLALGAYWMRPKEETPTVFELVAGFGDNYAATQAPAAGNTTAPVAIKVDIPEPPTPAVTPQPEPTPITPVAPEPAPVIQPVPEKKAAAPAPTPPKLPNYAKDVARLADKRAANVEKKFRAEQARKAAAEAKKAAEEQKRMTKEEFDRLNAKKPTATSKTSKSGPIRTAKIDVEGITGGVVGGSTANKTGGAGGKALEVQNRDLTQAYIMMIMERIRESVLEAGITDLLSARVQFRVSQWGTLSEATILTSSGSTDFDRAVLEAFRTIGKMPPPPSKQAEVFAVNLTLSELE
ncbi:MAG TPA: cell envelope integrity protein TolA [Opitutaceae bacterium]